MQNQRTNLSYLCPALMAFSCLLGALASAQVPHPATVPTEYVTFLSQGRPVSCAVYAATNAQATIIFLHGEGPADIDFGRQQAQFFAQRGFRVLLPEYLTATPSAKPTTAHYTRWAEVVEDIVADLRAHPSPQDRKIALAGQHLGASVALVAGSHRPQVEAIAEWSGLLPNEFFPHVQGMAPLLILHGEQDEEVPVVNARQLMRLCKLKDLFCEQQIYPGEGHVLADRAADAANQRVLSFFHAHLD